MRNHKLRPSIAVRNYDSIRPPVIVDVQIDGVDSIFMLQDPDEIFFVPFGTADDDVCELSFSSYSVKTVTGTSPYIAIPIFRRVRSGIPRSTCARIEGLTHGGASRIALASPQ